MLLRRTSVKIVAFFALLAATTLIPTAYVRAEGSYQAGLNQPFYDYNTTGISQINTVNRPFYVDIQTVGEVINVSACGESDSQNITIQIYDPSSVQVLNQTLSDGNVTCNDPFTSPSRTP